MTRRKPPAKWVLPVVINPASSSCVTVPVPDDPMHKAAFWGALLDLASAYKWSDDPDHTAKAVALVWRDIVDGLRYAPCDYTIPVHGIEQDDIMALRVDCDCNVWVTCCDGTEVQLATKAMVDTVGQPGGGATQPPVGGCTTIHGNINGNGLWVLPNVVSTGDTLVLANMVGATYNPANGNWYCPDGKQFFAGVCTPYPITAGGNPMPAVASGRLIAKIGSTYYDIQGSTFTVPAGIASAVVTLQFNYASIATSSGNVNFDITYCNKGSGSTYSHTFNYLAGTQGFTLNVDGTSTPTTSGLWVAGSGWTDTASTNGGNTSNSARIERTLSTPATVYGGNITVRVTKGTFNPGLNNGLVLYNGGSTVVTGAVAANTMPNGVNVIPIANGNYTVTRIFGLLYDAWRTTGVGANGTGEIQSITLNGPGPDPF